MSRRMIFLVMFLLVIFGVGAMVWQYFSSTKAVSVWFKNCSSATVISTIKNSSTVSRKTIQKSGDSVRISNNVSASVECSPVDGYAVTVAQITTNRVSLDPDFNNERNKAILKEVQPKIEELVMKAYPKSAEYNFISSAIMQNGEWCVVVLKPKQEDERNGDNLRIIAHKKDGDWSLVTKPEILFNTYAYPLISREVLLRANSV